MKKTLTFYEGDTQKSVSFSYYRTKQSLDFEARIGDELVNKILVDAYRAMKSDIFRSYDFVGIIEVLESIVMDRLIKAKCTRIDTESIEFDDFANHVKTFLRSELTGSIGAIYKRFDYDSKLIVKRSQFKQYPTPKGYNLSYKQLATISDVLRGIYGDFYLHETEFFS